MDGTKTSDADTPLRISLSRQQRDLLLEEIIPPVHLGRLIRVAPVDGMRFQIKMSLDELDELLDYIEDKAGETRNDKLRQEMYDLCEYLEQLGLRKIVDMEEFRRSINQFKQVPVYSQDGLAHHTQGRNSSIGEEVFPSDFNVRQSRPQEFSEMFLKFVEHQGRIPRSEIGGLSREQFTKLLKGDWDDEHGPIRFNKTLNLQDIQKAQIFYRARTLLGEVVDSGGIKATGAGNLNRKFVGLLLDRMIWPDGYIEHLHRMNRVINEQDVFSLHVIRIIMDLAGLLVLKNGVFSVSKKGKQLLYADQAGALYHVLFKTHFQRMNLDYLDRMPSVTGFQESVAYSLLMLSKVDKGWKRTNDLAPELLLPPVKTEMEKTGIEVHWFLSSRLFSPLVDFGLLQQKDLPEQHKRPGVNLVRKTALFDSFIGFHLG